MLRPAIGGMESLLVENQKGVANDFRPKDGMVAVSMRLVRMLWIHHPSLRLALLVQRPPHGVCVPLVRIVVCEGLYPSVEGIT
jgi:hypothetical protein